MHGGKDLYVQGDLGLPTFSSDHVHELALKLHLFGKHLATQARTSFCLDIRINGGVDGETIKGTYQYNVVELLHKCWIFELLLQMLSIRQPVVFYWL